MNKKSRVMTFSIMRFNPERDKKPYIQDYQLNVSTIPGKMLLNALEAIREKQPDIGLRRSCGEGVCGSDGMNINGKNGLACVTQLKTLPDRVVVRPLSGFPIIRDLIVDMEQFYAQYKKVKPYLLNNQETPQKERLQSPADRAKLDGSTNVFCALAVRLLALLIGGILINLLDPQDCYGLIDLLPIIGILRKKNA